MRFADRDDGYAFGPDLFVTHDGGRSWRGLDLGGPVTELAAGGGHVYALVGQGRHIRLLSSLPGTDSWSVLPAPRDLQGGLWVQGSDLFAQSSLKDGEYIGNDLLVSLDGGQTWVHHRVPSPGLGCAFDQVQSPVLWETCGTGMLASVWISHDNGATFTHLGRDGQDEFSNAVTFAAASNTVGVAGFQQLYRTTNSAHTFRTVDRHRLTWHYLGFTDAEHGAAIGTPGVSGEGPGQLWITRDAGMHWHRVPIEERREVARR